MDMKLNEYDKKLVDIHSVLSPFARYGTTGNTWYISTTEDDIKFKTYKAFINAIADDVKEALLAYAVSGELHEIARALGESVRRSLGHYSKTGMGGAQNVARRMRTSTKTASNFYNTFRSLRDDANFSLGKEISELKSRGADASEIIDAIVGHVCPKGGSVDEVSCRDSGTSALSEFMDHNPDADFGNLSDDQIWSLTAIYLGNEAFNRIQMDIGQAFEKQDVPYVDRVTRMNDMREYIQSEISTQMDALRKTADQNVDMNQLFQDTIKNTFEVFEVEV